MGVGGEWEFELSRYDLGKAFGTFTAEGLGYVCIH